MPYSLIDSHCHFDFEPLNNAALWQRCQTQGIAHLLIPGVASKQWPQARETCKRHPGTVYSAGIHPWWLDSETDNACDLLRDELKHPLCVAIGETGLDHAIDASIDRQLNFLERHLKLAEELDKPLILHCVKAHNTLIRQLKKHRFNAGGVIHAFSGSLELALSYWEMGFYLGVGGTITYPRAKNTRETFAQLPLESLLLETDAPDMPLYGRQGAANSPLFLTEIARCLAQLRNESFETIAAATTANAKTLFNFPVAP